MTDPTPRTTTQKSPLTGADLVALSAQDASDLLAKRAAAARRTADAPRREKRAAPSPGFGAQFQQWLGKHPVLGGAALGGGLGGLTGLAAGLSGADDEDDRNPWRAAMTGALAGAGVGGGLGGVYAGTRQSPPTELEKAFSRYVADNTPSAISQAASRLLSGTNSTLLSPFSAGVGGTALAQLAADRRWTHRMLDPRHIKDPELIRRGLAKYFDSAKNLDAPMRTAADALRGASPELLQLTRDMVRWDPGKLPDARHAGKIMDRVAKLSPGDRQIFDQMRQSGLLQGSAAGAHRIGPISRHTWDSMVTGEALGDLANEVRPKSWYGGRKDAPAFTPWDAAHGGYFGSRTRSIRDPSRFHTPRGPFQGGRWRSARRIGAPLLGGLLTDWLVGKARPGNHLTLDRLSKLVRQEQGLADVPN